MTHLRCLTLDGIGRFKQYLDQLRRERRSSPPLEILADPSYSRPCSLGEVTIEPRSFASRREFAAYIDERLQQAGILEDADEPGMWEWLSLFYFDEVCPVNRKGERTSGVSGRHLLEDADARRRHRHLLRGPYMLWRRFDGGPNGELDLLLSDALPVHSIAATHLVERQRLMSSQGVLTAASHLYMHPSSGKRRRGYSHESNGLRAFCRFLNNLPDCFDLASLSTDTIMALLPETFSTWLGSAEKQQDIHIESFQRLREVGALHDNRSVARDLGELLTEVNAREMTEREITVRSGIFRTAVVAAYDSQCAISGLGIRHADGSDTGFHFEVEAAHIIPVSRGGADLVQNGLALNRTIHWAFDRGMIWIDGNLRIHLSREVSTDSRNHWLQQFQDDHLKAPALEQHLPSREALRWHALNIGDADEFS